MIDLFSRIVYNRGMRIITGLILGLLAVSFLVALDPETPVEHYQVDRWLQTGTFPHESVNTLAQTPDGYLWIGTGDGLFRFDGQRFQPVTVDEKPFQRFPDINHLRVDKNGTLWAATFHGLFRYREGVWKKYSQAEGLSSNFIHTTGPGREGNTWAGMIFNKIDRLKGPSISHYDIAGALGKKRVYALLCDGKGFMWAGLQRAGLFRFADGKFNPVPLGPPDRQLSVYCLYETEKNTLWAGTNRGMIRVTEPPEALDTENGLSDNRVFSILEDSDHNLWVGTVKGLNRIRDIDGNGAGPGELLSNEFITCLLEDRERNLWAGTRGEGLFRIKDRVVTTYSTREGLSNFCTDLYRDKNGVIWIGTAMGRLYRYKDNTFEELAIEDDIIDMEIWAIGTGADGAVLVGTNGSGLLQIQKGKLSRAPARFDSGNTTVTTIFRDSHGRLWVGGNPVGLGYFEKDKFTVYSPPSRNARYKKQFFLYEDQWENLWIGTADGLHVIEKGKENDPGKNKKIYFKGAHISCIYRDGEGTTWVSTYGQGLKRIKGDARHSISRADGLMEDIIPAILEDRQENLWFGSPKGIFRVNKKEIEAFIHGQVEKVTYKKYGVPEGMRSRNCYPSALKTPDGQFWFSTDRGVSVLRPGKWRLFEQPPPIAVLKKATLNGESVPLRPSAVFEDAGTIGFLFGSTVFHRPHEVRYKTRLTGAAPTWRFHTPGAEGNIRYRDLSPGDYSFELYAGNSDGTWSETPVSFSFTLQRSFLKSPFFFLLLAVVGTALLGLGIYLYRIKKAASKTKYATSPLDDAQVAEYVQRLNHIIMEKELFRDDSLSLKLLSGKTGIPHHHLSQVINEHFKKNFYDFINQYRIEEVKKRLAGPGAENVSILEIAYEAGFSSKSAFNRAFKKFTNQTPTQFKRSIFNR